MDPITGAARMGGSSSGKEAARVVKFSPEGAPRDLLVFSEVSPFQLPASIMLAALPKPLPSPSVSGFRVLM